MNEQTQKAVDLLKSQATGEAVVVETEKKELSAADKALDEAIQQMKQQLRFEKKETLIHQWIGLYAQVIQLTKENEVLREKQKQTTAESSAAAKGNE
jgi:hypothetical protein